MPTRVITPTLSMVATDKLLVSYVLEPVLLVTRALMVGTGVPQITLVLLKLKPDKVGIAAVTTRGAVVKLLCA